MDWPHEGPYRLSACGIGTPTWSVHLRRAGGLLRLRRGPCADDVREASGKTWDYGVMQKFIKSRIDQY